jgi:alpha-glucosidase
MQKALFLICVVGALLSAGSLSLSPQNCPGYKVSSLKQRGNSLTADLTLAGSPCNVYGTDLKDLKLQVDYETGRL